MKVSVTLSGGLDLVFDNRKQLQIQLKENSTIGDLVQNLSLNHANSKRQMFALDHKLRAGILVLINDADWQLFDKEKTVLNAKDEVVFISTLHGG